MNTVPYTDKDRSDRGVFRGGGIGGNCAGQLISEGIKLLSEN